MTVAPNLVHARGRGSRATVKHRQRVPLLFQCSRGEPPDEPIPAD